MLGLLYDRGRLVPVHRSFTVWFATVVDGPVTITNCELAVDTREQTDDEHRG